MLWCECPLGSMLWCECPLIGMQWCECLYGSMPWCECPIGSMHGANAPLLVCDDVNVCMEVCHDASVPLGVWHKCFDVNTIYSKILFIFKIRLPQYLKNIFKTWFIIPKKSSSFWLEAPKKLVITIRNLRTWHWLRIWWSGSKDLSSQFGWAKGVARF